VHICPPLKYPKNGMLSLIQDFPNHLTEALAICQNSTLKPASGKIENVLITGLGGSGIGGTIVADLVAKQSKVPFVVNKDYQIPAFVGPNTLVFVCSYSGNTEETLMAMQASVEAGAQIAVITSGGIASKRADELKVNKIVVPGGNPPRSMLGYSLVALLFYIEHYKLANVDLAAQIPAITKMLLAEQDAMKLQAQLLAPKLQDKVFVVYAAEGMGGVATRWRQQLNENSKMVGWDAVVPEMNHNELVGWDGGTNAIAALFLRSNHDFSRNAKRIEINKELILPHTPHVFEIWAKQGTALAEALYLICWGDWLSYYLSELNKVDIMDIKAIDYLKSELSKL